MDILKIFKRKPNKCDIGNKECPMFKDGNCNLKKKTHENCTQMQTIKPLNFGEMLRKKEEQAKNNGGLNND